MPDGVKWGLLITGRLHPSVDVKLFQQQIIAEVEEALLKRRDMSLEMAQFRVINEEKETTDDSPASGSVQGS